MTPITIGQIVAEIKPRLATAGYPDNEARAITHMLLKRYTGLNPAELYINLDKEASNDAADLISKATTLLEQHYPLQYIIGETEFYGLPFIVNNNVLIPRPETEELVQWVINDYSSKSCFTLLDIGTGSGCIAIALAKNLPNVSIFALDISAGALQVAQQNAMQNGVNIEFIQHDILSRNEFTLQKFDCIVSNPPYVRNSEKQQMHANVLNNEPHTALFVDDDAPLLFYHAIARAALNHLAHNGTIYVEINEALPAETAALFSNYGFTTTIRNDINGKPRMIKAIR